MNFFVIRLPLTYLNALEAQSYFHIKPEESVLIILYLEIDSVDIRQINKILDPGQWSEIHYLPHNVESLHNGSDDNKENYKKISYAEKWKNIRRFVRRFDEVLKDRQGVEKIFIGDYSIASMRHIVNTLKVKERNVFLLDEGLRVYRNYRTAVSRKKKGTGYIFDVNKWKYFVASLIFSYRMEELKAFSYFSSWDLPETEEMKVYKNDFRHLKKNIDNLEKSSSVYFLGAPWLDRKLIDPDVLFAYYKKIKEHFSGRKIVYVPHRDEQQKYIDFLAENTGFEIVNFHLPIEYVICFLGPVPSAIASFHSSALQTCSNILGENSRVVSFYMNTNDLCSSIGKDMEAGFKYYESIETDYFQVVRLS